MVCANALFLRDAPRAALVSLGAAACPPEPRDFGPADEYIAVRALPPLLAYQVLAAFTAQN